MWKPCKCDPEPGRCADQSVRPGRPVENAFAESFNGRLRDECLNTNWFMSVRHARGRTTTRSGLTAH